LKTYEVFGVYNGRPAPLTQAVNFDRATGKVLGVNAGYRVMATDSPSEGFGLAGSPGRWSSFVTQSPLFYGLDPDRGILAWDGSRGQVLNASYLLQLFGDWRQGLSTNTRDGGERKMAKDITVRVTGQNPDGTMNISVPDGATNPFMQSSQTAMVPYNPSSQAQTVGYRARMGSVEVMFASEADFLKADKAFREQVQVANVPVVVAAAARAVAATACCAPGQALARRRRLSTTGEPSASAWTSCWKRSMRSGGPRTHSDSTQQSTPELVPALVQSFQAERDATLAMARLLEDQLLAVDIQTGAGVARVVSEVWDGSSPSKQHVWRQLADGGRRGSGPGSAPEPKRQQEPRLPTIATTTKGHETMSNTKEVIAGAVAVALPLWVRAQDDTDRDLRNNRLDLRDLENELRACCNHGAIDSLEAGHCAGRGRGARAEQPQDHPCQKSFPLRPRIREQSSARIRSTTTSIRPASVTTCPTGL
jgi:hypothetical protein